MKKLFILFLMISLAGCDTNQDERQNQEINENPPAEGFNREASDPKAIAIADNVMQAMGGRRAWDTTRFIKWNFFGRRDLLWDKKTGNVRIEAPFDSTVYLVNVKQDTGSVYVKGEKVDNPDTVQNLISKAKSIWINDSYWLFMPFKLKDSGVTLKYAREDTLPSAQPADVLQLTFEDVGRTPQNKYEVYVDRSDNLVKQWTYFAEASQDEPSAVWPWDNYQQIGPLKLSYNRSDDKGPKDVEIYTDVPEDAFTSPNEPAWNTYPTVD